MRWRGLRRFLAESSGIAAVEFALVLPVFLVGIFGIFDFGRLFWLRNTLQYSAEETGRYAMAHTGATASELRAYAQNTATGMRMPAVTFAVTLETVSGMRYATITADYRFTFIGGLIPGAQIELTGRSRVPLVS